MADSVSQPKLTALHSLRRARHTLLDRLENALRADDLPPLAWYDVLYALEGAGEHGLRPRDLAFEVALTPSGLTRLLDRIAAAGLVERTVCPSDRRGFNTTLTPAGHETLAMMRPVYMRELEAGFGSLITDAEAEQITAILGRVSSSACTLAGEEAAPQASAA
jgi:DNA-binding MarR family transcriptional regulator